MKDIGGIEVEQVGDLLDGVSEDAPVSPLTPPRLEGQPEFPEPGIYFNMPESVYHSIVACSSSGLKDMSASSMIWWAKSPLNPEREVDEDTVAKALGRAYHVRICEGAEAFAERYYVELDKGDYPGWPEHTEAIASALSAAADVAAVGGGNMLPLCVTVDHLRRAIDLCGGKPKGTAKEGLINQLYEFSPEWPIWDVEVKRHAEANEGKVGISLKQHKRIEIAARMIENDPQLGQAFKDGHAEVSLFWYDEKTGAPMKARLDYLKLLWLVDLKSFANQQGKPVQRAIDMAISNYKYFIPVVVYLEGIAAVKKLVRSGTGGFVRDYTKPDGRPDHDLVKWAWQWAHQPEPEVLFIFQMTGIAPVTRGRIMPKRTTYTVSSYAVQALKKRWVDCARTYGVDPWLDIAPVVTTEDEAMTWAATDFGDEEAHA